MAERREELLRAAIEQIEARGVAAVRIADVAAALGVSNALVLYHFSTKEQLVAAAFAHAAEGDLAHLRKLLGKRTTALRRLRSAVRWYAPTGQAKGWRLWIEGWAAALREPALRAGQVLGIEVPADPDQPWPPQPPRGTLEVRRDDIHWAREFLVPWIGRRLRGESSGDHVAAKRPDLLPL